MLLDSKDGDDFSVSLAMQANPIRKFNNIVISPSDKELTIPEAPQLSVRSRRRDQLAMADSEESSGAGSASPSGSDGKWNTAI